MAAETQRDLELRVLEFIYESQSPDGADPAGIGALRGLVGDDHATGTVVRALKERGLVRVDGRLSPHYFTTAEGTREVQDMQARRASRRHRRAAALDHLLEWVDSNSPSRDTRLDRDKFDGSADLVPFTADEVEEAAETLVAAGLLKSRSSAQKRHYLLEVTRVGRDCVDEGLGATDFLAQRCQPGPAGNVVHVSGGQNTIAAAFAAGSTATATHTVVNVDLALLVAAAVRQAADALDLPPDPDGALPEALADIEQAQDPSRLKRGLVTVGRLLGDTSTGALGSVLATLAAQALGLGG
jgi:hypothetical protein